MGKDKRDIRSVPIKLDLNKNLEREIHDYLKELARLRERKAFLIDGIRLASAKREQDFQYLAELLPAFTEWIRAETLKHYQSPANIEFETMMYHTSLTALPAPAPTIEDEPEIDVEQVAEETFDDLADLFEF